MTSERHLGNDGQRELDPAIVRAIAAAAEARALEGARMAALGYAGTNYERFFGSPARAAESVSRLVDMSEELGRGESGYSSPFTDNFKVGGACEFGLCHQETLERWLSAPSTYEGRTPYEQE